MTVIIQEWLLLTLRSLNVLSLKCYLQVKSLFNFKWELNHHNPWFPSHIISDLYSTYKSNSCALPHNTHIRFRWDAPLYFKKSLTGSLLSETHQMLLSCLSLLVFCRMSVLLLLLKWLLCLRPGVPQSHWLGREWCSSSPLSGWRRYTPSITPPQTRPGQGLSGGMPQHAHTIGIHHIDTHTR